MAPKLTSKNIAMLAGLVVVVLGLWYYMGSPKLIQGFADGGDATFTMYYVDWCPHCVSAKPKFQNFMGNGTVNIKGKSVKCAMVNPEKSPEAVSGLNIKGYPSFMLSKGGKLVEFSGPRTEEGWKSFLNENM
jgi:thiol-disulfide isomerase/thioredoxin